MPTYIITAPDGTKYKVTGPGSEQEALAQVQAQHGAAQPDSPAVAEMKQFAGQALQDKGAGIGRSIDSAVRGAADTMSFGLADEAAALGNATIDAMRGKSGQYDRRLRQERIAQDQRDMLDPISSNVGRIAGAVTGGVGAARNGLTLAGTKFAAAAPTTAAALEGAGWGGAYGFGSGQGVEDRLWKGAEGAATGAAFGAATQKVGDAITSRLAARQAAKAAPVAAAGDELAQEGSALYTKMRNMGITIKPSAILPLKANVKLGLAKTNRDLAPKAFGLQKMLNKLSDAPDVGELHNFAKSVNRVLRSRLEADDPHYVGLIKDQLMRTRAKITVADLNGARSREAFDMWKQADDLWARHEKADFMEKIMANAAVDAEGRYTQSGLANAIRREMTALHKKILKGTVKGYTPDEIALVRQMARGGSNSALINLFSKFAPRGVVSTLGGYTLGGPGVMAGGYIAGKIADRGALKAAETLRDAVARGHVLRPPQLPNVARELIGASGEGGASMVMPRRKPLELTVRR